MADALPWLTLAGLGAFHGLNPAMGWLFAVALGMHRRSRRVVLAALVPITLGHALAVALVAGAVVAAGAAIAEAPIRYAAGTALIAWGVYHRLYGSRHRVRVGMQAGMLGLGAWSFLMATAHGAGIMLAPVLIPLAHQAGPAGSHALGGSVAAVLTAILVHTAAMVATTGVVAVIVYEWLGLAFLRRGWINLDLLWSVALVVTGAIVILLAGGPHPGHPGQSGPAPH